MSFPTSVVVGKNSKIEYVHTGFSGPATGEIYEKYVKEMDLLIKKLLQEFLLRKRVKETFEEFCP
jgi:hypothetical protein